MTTDNIEDQIANAMRSSVESLAAEADLLEKTRAQIEDGPKTQGHRFTWISSAAVVLLIAAFAGGAIIKSNDDSHHTSQVAIHTTSTNVNEEQSLRLPTVNDCPSNQNTPALINGSFCGPAPTKGSGSGDNGVCADSDTSVPCGAGVEQGKYYNFTISGSCNGLIRFDGREWVSALPPSTDVAPFFTWIQLSNHNQVQTIGPSGVVSYALATSDYKSSSCRD